MANRGNKAEMEAKVRMAPQGILDQQASEGYLARVIIARRLGPLQDTTNEKLCCLQFIVQ